MRLPASLDALLVLSTLWLAASARPDEDDDDEPVRLIFKYKDAQRGKSDIAGMGLMGVDVPKLRIGSMETTKGMYRAMQRNPNFESVDIDYDVEAIEDPMLRGSIHRNLAENNPFGLAMVEADQLDLPIPTGDPIKVCVVDTGYDVTHEDLPSGNVDGFDQYGDAWDVDGNNHGTHVAGTIGAIGGNDIGVNSILKNSTRFEFFIAKGLRDSGSGTTAGVVAAVEACADAGAKVINLSLGGGSPTTTVENAFRDVFDQGALIVAAAGNGGNNNYLYPASYPDVMSVAAVNANGARTSFSQFNDQVEIAAPGQSVQSTIPGDRYAFFSGTSMASPHVAGVAALVWAHFPECSNLQIRNVLLRSAEDGGTSGCDNFYGHGIVKAKAAYDLLAAEGCGAGGSTPNLPSDGNVGGCAQETTPLDPTPSPVDPVTPSPVNPVTPSPIQDTTPSPVNPPTPSPVNPDTPAPGPIEDGECMINVRSDNSNYHGALDVGFDVSTVVLDFTNTGLDLNQVSPQRGEFLSMTVDAAAQTITLERKFWMSKTNPGYLGINGNNIPGLSSFTAPTCTVVEVPTPAPAPTPPIGDACSIMVPSSNNPWHGALNVGFDIPTVVLDFTDTGLNLAEVSPVQGDFVGMTVDVANQQIVLTKAGWMSKTNKGYLGINGSNVAGLASFTAPSCSAAP